jgi:HEAT repeat protein
MAGRQSTERVRDQCLDTSVSEPKSRPETAQAEAEAETPPEVVKAEVLSSLKREETFEQAFRTIASLRGRNASASGRRLSRLVWRQDGRLAAAADWLARRIFNESDPEIARSAGEVLSDMGQEAVEAILRVLEPDSPQNSWIPLMDSLAWVESPSDTVTRLRIAAAIRRAFAAHDPEVRLAAVRAARALGVAEALPLLNELRSTATPTTLIEIDELINEFRE